MPELSAAEREFIERKHAQTLKLRQEFLKTSSNPYRHALGEGGTIYDTALARFQAMRVSGIEHFKPTGRSFKVGFFTVVLPIMVYGWMLKSDRDSREKLFRTGQVAYKDRRFKFI